jgi:integrase
MELSVKEFLESVVNPNTKKEYRYGIRRFCEWYGKTAEEILELRKEDLTQRPNENLIEYRNRAARFDREIEKFHGYLLEHGSSANTARNLTIGIRQLFRFYQMPIRIRAGSKVAKTVKTTKNFLLTIEHVRAMFKVADLRERIILSMATDLGLRVGDFISIKKADLPPLDQEPPISFELMTRKEEVVAHAFLSRETVDLLKAYLPTLEKKNGNPCLFPSNGTAHISDEWLNKLLQRLAENAKIDPNGKSLTFHCFRKMFLSAAIDSGIGLTAGKKLCGKAIAESDDTYLTTVNLKDKFLQLKRFLTLAEQPRSEVEKIDSLKNAIKGLQEELTQQKLITETISEENIKTKQKVEKLQPLSDFIESFKDEETLRLFLNLLKNAERISLPQDEGTFAKIDFTPELSDKIDKVARKRKITRREAIDQLIDKGIKELEKKDRSA